MSVNGIYNTTISETYTTNTTVKEKSEKKEDTAVKSEQQTTESGAVYEKTKLSEDDRKAIVNQLKADMEKRQAQLTELVNNMIGKQTNAYGTANNIWQFLAKGDFTVDEETRKKAQEEISEDGYWGVKQTSDRIIDFAQALAGDDTEALSKMKDAFVKGYKQAEKTWGGKLPDISQRTYDAVMEKFDKLLNPTTDDTDKKAENADGTVIVKPSQDTTTTEPVQ